MRGGRSQQKKGRLQAGTVKDDADSPLPVPARAYRPPLPLPTQPSPPLTRQELERYIIPKSVPLEAVPYSYDPYGGVPRREDRDPYNTMQPPLRPAHYHDLQPTHQSFRDVVLSMQSWGARWPEPTDTSIKRWARRAIRADAPNFAKRQDVDPPPPPPASASPARDDDKDTDGKAEDANGEESPTLGDAGDSVNQTSNESPRNTQATE